MRCSFPCLACLQEAQHEPPEGGSRADCNLRPFASQTLPGPPRPDSPRCREHRRPFWAVPSKPLITRTSVKGCEALRLQREVPPDRGSGPDRALALRRVPPPRGGCRQTRRNIGTPAPHLRSKTSRRPQAVDPLPEPPGEQAILRCRRPRDLTVTADDLLAGTPVMLEARPPIDRSTDGKERGWASRARTHLDQLFRRLSTAKKNRPPVGGRFSYRASQNGAYLCLPSR
jgi:hypothetical protein